MMEWNTDQCKRILKGDANNVMTANRKLFVQSAMLVSITGVFDVKNFKRTPCILYHLPNFVFIKVDKKPETFAFCRKNEQKLIKKFEIGVTSSNESN